MGSNKLLEVFAVPEKFQIQAEGLPQDKPLFFESSRLKGSPGAEIGESTIVSRLEFKKHFEEFTHSFLNQVRTSLKGCNPHVTIAGTLWLGSGKDALGANQTCRGLSTLDCLHIYQRA